MAGQPIRGLTAQSMRGTKRFRTRLAAPPVNLTTGSGTVTARSKCFAHIFAWGAGASGQGGTGAAGGAGGGGALYKRVPLQAGDVLTYAVGVGGLGSAGVPNPGTDTTITLPNGATLTAGGATGLQGGQASGGDVNRRGGNGGTTGLAGSPGDHGGPGGAAGGGSGGGGGSAGLDDILPDYVGAAGGAGGGSFGGSPGGGSGGNAGMSATAGNGLLVIVLVQASVA
jgi:hypothetical protein